MRLESKFEIGDIIYTYDVRHVLNKNCGFCEGQGKVECVGKINEEILFAKCPKCNGTGNVPSKKGGSWSSKKEYYVQEVYPVTRMRSEKVKFKIVKIEWNGEVVRYICDMLINGKSWSKIISIEETKAYKTREECQAWCEEMNAQQKFD